MSRSSVGSEGRAQLLVKGTEMVQVSSPVRAVYQVPDWSVCTGTLSPFVTMVYLGTSCWNTCTGKCREAKTFRSWGNLRLPSSVC
jgi:hypothetical protein